MGGGGGVRAMHGPHGCEGDGCPFVFLTETAVSVRKQPFYGEKWAAVFPYFEAAVFPYVRTLWHLPRLGRRDGHDDGQITHLANIYIYIYIYIPIYI